MRKQKDGGLEWKKPEKRKEREGKLPRSSNLEEVASGAIAKGSEEKKESLSRGRTMLFLFEEGLQ